MKRFILFFIVIVLTLSILTVTTFCVSNDDFSEETIEQFERLYEHSFSRKVNRVFESLNNNSNKPPDETISDTGSIYFNIFDIYRNEMKFVYGKYGSNTVNDFVSTTKEDGLVTLQQHNITLITNRVYNTKGEFDISYLLNNYAGVAQDIHKVALSTPTNQLLPTFALDEYNGYTLEFSVNLTLEIVMFPDSKFTSNYNELEIVPAFYFYFGESPQYSYETVSAKVKTNYVRLYNDTTLSYDYTVSYTIDGSKTLCGFWTGLTFPKYLFTNGNDGPGLSKNCFYVATYELSPMYFEITDYGIGVREDISELDMSAYEYYMGVDKPTFNKLFTNQTLLNTLSFYSSFINKFYNNVPFIRFLINCSLACAFVSIVMGVSIGLVRVSDNLIIKTGSLFKSANKKTKSNNKKSNNKKGG